MKHGLRKRSFPKFAAAVHATETVRAFLESRGCMDYHSLYGIEKTVHDTKEKLSVQWLLKNERNCENYVT